jgi:hypothetical protein
VTMVVELLLKYENLLLKACDPVIVLAIRTGMDFGEDWRNETATFRYCFNSLLPRVELVYLNLQFLKILNV